MQFDTFMNTTMENENTLNIKQKLVSPIEHYSQQFIIFFCIFYIYVCIIQLDILCVVCKFFHLAIAHKCIIAAIESIDRSIGLYWCLIVCFEIIVIIVCMAILMSGKFWDAVYLLNRNTNFGMVDRCTGHFMITRGCVEY